MKLAPGKRGAGWVRDLEVDLDAIRRGGADVLVTLLTAEELDMMGLRGFFGRATAAGLVCVWSPIRKGIAVLEEGVLFGTASAVAEHLEQGRRVVIHCSGGLGRTGLITAANLNNSPEEPFLERETRVSC